MISGIHTVSVSGEEQELLFQQVESTSTSTTIRFTVPDDTDSIDIKGAIVVPEFPLAIIIAASAMASIVFISSLWRNSIFRRN